MQNLNENGRFPGTQEGFNAYNPAVDPHTVNPYQQPDSAWFNFHSGWRKAELASMMSRRDD